MQLHRIALESHGMTNWRHINNVPVSDMELGNVKLPWLTEWSEKSFFIEQEDDITTDPKAKLHLKTFKAWRR